MAGAGHLLRPQKAQETDFPGSCDLQELLNTEQSMINYSIVMRSVNANLLITCKNLVDAENLRIFAPAIEGTAYRAKNRSSMKTGAGLK